MFGCPWASALGIVSICQLLFESGYLELKPNGGGDGHVSAGVASVKGKVSSGM